MKLRIRSNSIRLRLGPREVRTLLNAGSLQESVRFGPGDTQVLRYRLVLTTADAPVSARIEASDIVVTLARSTAQAWADDDGLTLTGEQPAGAKTILQILIEKDLQCRETPAEAEEDVYPNPSTACL